MQVIKAADEMCDPEQRKCKLAAYVFEEKCKCCRWVDESGQHLPASANPSD
jgi:hypothetical protein